MNIRILILEDNSALETFLKGIKEYIIVGGFENGDRFAVSPNDLEPGVTITDCGVQNEDGTDRLQMIRKMKPGTAFIMYTVFEEDQNLFDSLQAGANGDLFNNIIFKQLLEVIANTRNGGDPLPPSIGKTVLPTLHIKNNYNLSRREKEVLQYLVKGYSYRMIADAIFVCLSTVQAHVKKIYTKLHVNSGRQAVAIALEEKIV